MPYNPEILKQKAIEAIEKNKLIFIEDICAYIGIAKSTYYEHFPINSNDSNELSDLLEKNKINLKVSIRKKWFESDRDTGLMALYKLCSTPEEHKKLQQNYTDNTSSDGSMSPRDPFATRTCTMSPLAIPKSVPLSDTTTPPTVGNDAAVTAVSRGGDNCDNSALVTMASSIRMTTSLEVHSGGAAT
jgi:hypothetical protein